MNSSKHSAAVHEAGHAVAAQLLGCRLIWCRIMKHQEEWTGDTSWVLGPNAAWPIVGLAGIMAEALAANRQSSAIEIHAAINDQELEPSATDWLHIGELKLADVEQCRKLLSDNWELVERNSMRLESEGNLDCDISVQWSFARSPFPLF